MLHLKITAIKSETAECKTFFFHSEEKPHYEAGQFLTFLFERNGKEIRRSYSFSSSPDTDDYLAITIKRTSNGELSRWWMEYAKVGDLLTALEPAGVFTIHWQDKPRDIFLAAAGSGITPMYSIIKTALIREPQSSIHLLYSNREASKTIFLHQLTLLQKQYPGQLSIFWLFSNNKNLLTARLGTYNLQRIIKQALRYKLEEAMMYTCGPYDYMHVVQITCLTMGFSKAHIRKELFDINALPPLTKRYFDKTDRTISLLYQGNKFSLFVPYNETILDAALKKGIDIPFSCKAGKCSTCKCVVRSGAVWMHYNEVLTDDDEAKGFALTCTGHPASENVVIRIF